MLTAAAVSLSACASTSPPALEAPGAFTAAPDETTAIAGEDWLAAFGSPELTALVGEALEANPSLQGARERARSARLSARADGGRWLPDLSVGLGSSRTETPTGSADERTRLDLTTSEISTSWEADLWGRVLDGARAGFADARAAEADLDAARLSIAGGTARAYIQLVQSRQLLDLAYEDLRARESALQITERRYQSGVLNALSLRTARSQVASARANLASQGDEVLQASRRLQVLLGRYPDGTYATNAELPLLSALAAPGAPADLLARRPDVAAAEARLASRGFRASQARKALLPRLTLTASAGASGDGLRDVTDLDALVTRVAAGLVMPIFNGGALRADAAAAAAEARASATVYVETALSAWAEVETALSADTALGARETELQIASDEAREAQALAEREYANGVATIFELIDAYTRRIDAERALIQARSARVTNRVNYHVALGGGAETGGLSTSDASGNQEQ
jgi:NodT family efflux transporter outer membrane factor (OMF) lipoprotein